MPGKGTLPRTCQQCGTPFLAQKHHVAAGRGRFCGRPCWDAAKRTAVERRCQHCGIPFVAFANRVALQRALFCSHRCHSAAAARRLERHCEVCGTAFWPTGQQVRNGGGRFCSARCSQVAHRGPGSSSWRGGRLARPDRYVVMKLSDGSREYEHRLIWAAAHGPIPDGYEVHHVNGVRHDNRLENLLLLTVAEHRALHRAQRHAGVTAHSATPGSSSELVQSPPDH